ncbi:hypothetical protein [Streptomyces sp. YGL11-2]|uniref:hypothetical protein n=1 Tax=Streptomyces sp. YGL11-2 TaxID=3414028 RepID=UPI003CF1EECF
MAVATGIAMSGVFTIAAAHTASASVTGGTIPYAECMKDLKVQHGTEKSPAIVCDAMAKQGWIQQPTG